LIVRDLKNLDFAYRDQLSRAGIGYLGVAAVMAMFFCLTNAVLWGMNYGKNPIDEARRKTKREKFSKRV
jgi:hypothetical protein